MSVQNTLTGSEADCRRVPDTLLYCERCDDSVLRSRRFEHEHDLADADPVEDYTIQKLESKVPEAARVETQTYAVEFTYEYVETVRVEAEDKSEAKWKAEEEATHDGELMSTLHTSVRSWGEPSAATLEYLENHRLLPDDHDVTQSDVEAVMAE